MADYYCSKCGAVAGQDARAGSLDVYLTCNCDKQGQWINDGRGGYWSSDARPISEEENERRNPPPDYVWESR
jgi:hypothetical protein